MSSGPKGSGAQRVTQEDTTSQGSRTSGVRGQLRSGLLTGQSGGLPQSRQSVSCYELPAQRTWSLRKCTSLKRQAEEAEPRGLAPCYLLLASHPGESSWPGSKPGPSPSQGASCPLNHELSFRGGWRSLPVCPRSGGRKALVTLTPTTACPGTPWRGLPD